MDELQRRKVRVGFKENIKIMQSAGLPTGTLYFCIMKKWKKIVEHRFGPLAVLALIVCLLSFIIRLVLMIKSWGNLDLNPLSFAGIFLVGLFYDLVVWSFFAMPVAFYCWLMKDSWYQKKWSRIPLFILFTIITLILVFSAGGEIVFGMSLMYATIL
ncbi:MAG: hypothetical protein IPP48_08010 [Chitinophagaceae bacterium]|nr:hypothetical protein [Chitinophagaceae bacterium]